MHIVLSRDHVGKPGKNDLGAGADLDGDGTVETHEMEANLTPFYINACKDLATRTDHDVSVVEEGWYSKRHEDAILLAASEKTQPTAYISCHLNAGGGDYAAVFYDYRSKNGERLASKIAGALGQLQMPGVSRVGIIPANPNNWTKHAFNTIKGIYSGPANISAVCFEPLFIDNKKHQLHLTEEGLGYVGRALALGCMRWAGSNNV